MSDQLLRISEKVWRKGWQREATRTQAASALLAQLIRGLEDVGLVADAEVFRTSAMQHGAENFGAIVDTAAREWRGRREVSS
jgi:hypothetical protein